MPTPVALKPEAKMASAGLAPDNEIGDYQNRSAASKIGGHREMVEEQGKLMSENRSPRLSLAGEPLLTPFTLRRLRLG